MGNCAEHSPRGVQKLTIIRYYCNLDPPLIETPAMGMLPTFILLRGSLRVVAHDHWREFKSVGKGMRGVRRG